MGRLFCILGKAIQIWSAATLISTLNVQLSTLNVHLCQKTIETHSKIVYNEMDSLF